MVAQILGLLRRYEAVLHVDGNVSWFSFFFGPHVMVDLGKRVSSCLRISPANLIGHSVPTLFDLLQDLDGLKIAYYKTNKEDIEDATKFSVPL